MSDEYHEDLSKDRAHQLRENRYASCALFYLGLIVYIPAEIVFCYHKINNDFLAGAAAITAGIIGTYAWGQIMGAIERSGKKPGDEKLEEYI